MTSTRYLRLDRNRSVFSTSIFIENSSFHFRIDFHPRSRLEHRSVAVIRMKKRKRKEKGIIVKNFRIEFHPVTADLRDFAL